MNFLHLKDDIFSWYPRTDSGCYAKQDGWYRPYDYLEIAYKVIDNHSAPFELIDCVSNLKRAIDHRVKKLAFDYQLKSMNRFGLPKESLQKLQLLGLAKPAIIKTITSIRNVVEHQFEGPPRVGRCSELADFTWYFLKSTDGVCRNIPDAFLLSHNYASGYDDKYWLEFSIGREKLWEDFRVHGWIQVAHLDLKQESELKIEADSFQSLKDSERSEVDIDELRDLGDETPIHIGGRCLFTDAAYIKLVQSYFSADRHS